MKNAKNKQPYLGRSKAWLVLGCAGLFYCYQFVLRVSPNIMTEELMQAFSIDAGSLGFIAAFYYYAYAGMQIPLGLIMDRFGPRRLLSLAGLTCGISCFLFAHATNPNLASCARFMMGIGAACGFLGTLKLGTIWFKPRQFGNVISFAMITGTLGAALGGAPLEYFVKAVGWRFALQFIGLVGVLIGIVIYAFVRDSPDPTSPNQTYQIVKNENFFSGLRLVITNPQVWIISLFGMLMYVPLVIIGDLWGVSFVENVFGISETIAPMIITAMFFGVAIGSPIFTNLSDRISKRRLPMVIGVFLNFILFGSLLFFDTLPLTILYVFFFLGGLFLTAKALCWASICESIPLKASGVAIGFSNMMVMLSGVIGHPLAGWLLDYNWDGSIVQGIPIYTADNYRLAFAMFPVCLGIALLLSSFIRETYPTTSDN
jgi:sugar phosphate permease